MFDWSLACLGPNKKLTVLRFMTFKDSPYETPQSIEKLEEENKKGHIVLLEGVKTGSAKVTNNNNSYLRIKLLLMYNVI